MGPEHLKAITAVLSLIEMMSGWPFAMLLLAIVVGPWMCAILLHYSHLKRFESAVRMYEDNVKLVEDYTALAKDLHDVVIVNTQAFQRLDDDINSNQFCPAVRLEKRAQGAQG